RDQAYGNWRDFFLNKKGSVTSVSGDANLDQIADVSYLLDTFFAKVTRTALQKRDQAYGNWRDFFLNKKGSVTSVSGDANLDQIA
ncbi:hypothetical protein CKQ90_33395, partial [Klebsiella pneumoniae]